MPTLNWLTRDKDIHAAKNVPYRLLGEASELSAEDTDADNMLIQGDNLEALKALLPFYAGQVKLCQLDSRFRGNDEGGTGVAAGCRNDERRLGSSFRRNDG